MRLRALWQVRETSDHGCFNSWDRLPYLTTVRTGVPSLIPAESYITRNFFINNYHTTWPIGVYPACLPIPTDPKTRPMFNDRPGS